MTPERYTGTVPALEARKARDRPTKPFTSKENAHLYTKLAVSTVSQAADHIMLSSDRITKKNPSKVGLERHVRPK